MICPNCGNQNSDDVSRCQFCGQRLAPKNPAPDTSQNQTQGNPSGNDRYNAGENRPEDGSNTSQYYWNNPYNTDNQQNSGWNNQQNQQFQNNPNWNNQQNQQFQNNPNWNGQTPYNQPYQNNNWNGEPRPSTNTLGLVSLIVSIISGMLCCFVPYISIPLAIVGIVLGIISLKKPGGKGMGVAGICIGGVMLIAGILLLVMVFQMMRSPDFYQYFRQFYEGM